jgi:hypothetical protein
MQQQPPPPFVVVLPPGQPPPPQQPEGILTTLGGLLVLGVFVGGILTTVILALFPVAARLVAPAVCPGDTQRVLIERWTTSSSRGGKNVNWDIYCLDAQGFGTIPDSPYPSLLFWASASALVFLVFFVPALLARRRKS